MWGYIIPALSAIMVAIIEWIASKDRKREKDYKNEVEKRAELRARESRLSMEMMSATMQLSIVTANALTGGHNNGNVEEAKKSASEAQKNYKKFLEEVAAKEISK